MHAHTGTTVAIALAALVLAAGQARAQSIDPALRGDIETFLKLTGAEAVGAQLANTVAAQVIDQMKRTQPNVPDRAVTVVKEVLTEEFSHMFDGPNGLHERMVAVYARHFSHDEMSALISFYSSDIGKKVIAEMPAVTQEGAAVGQEWAIGNMPRIGSVLEKRLRDEKLLP